MKSKELVALLADRGYEIKSASSTIDNITAEALIEELKPEEAEKVETASPPSDGKEAEESSREEQSEDDSAVPAAAPIVKSKEDVERERLEKLEKEESSQEIATSDSSSSEITDEDAASTFSGATVPTPPVLPKPAVGMVPPPPAAVRSASGSPSATSSADSEATVPDEASPAKGKVLQVKPPIVVRDFAGLVGLKPFQLISELMEMGIFASMNQTIDEDLALEIASSRGFELDIQRRGEKPEGGKAKKEAVAEDDESLLETRPPVVCILGHVDHGKTTLLDTVRQADVVSGEAGGITQHVGAYQIERNGQKITFLDTPGHAAFSKMRERGANLTDVAVLVVAADDGFMPQTDEALKFAQRAQGAIVVAINKIDVKGADLDKVKTHMQERGIASEDWGGETVTVAISALNGENVDDLLDMILLQAEVMELKANPNAVSQGVVVEARQEVGRGATATAIVQKGTLKVGDAIVSGSAHCKVKAMLDDHGEQVKQALPSTPVNILGWSDAPLAGATFLKVKNEREACRLADEVASQAKIGTEPQVQVGEDEGEEDDEEVSGVDALFAAIAKTKATAYRVILRADVRGSVEALQSSLEEIVSDKIDLEVVQAEVGQITKNDISMANMSSADVIGFNTKMENGVMGEAKHHGVHVFQNNIIYELIDLVKDNMADLLEPELVEKKTGRAEVREVFRISRGRSVAGSMVMEGSITRNATARLVRGDEILAEGKIDTLKRFKDDATEVKAGFECGIRLDGFDRYEEGDAIETFEIEKIRPSL